MVLYGLFYTGLGQFVAAYAPNATFAALTNPLIIGTLVAFAGVLVPYQAITSFWRYWMYYLITPFLAENPGDLLNANSTDLCEYCVYSKGSEYLAGLNLPNHVDGWRNICITLIFVLSSNSLVFVLMKLRSKKSKSAN
ncbi:hypothetical protein RQP46_010806 [Phenoliferia psychrophenolica]